jgi:hypothetical protein
MRDQTIHIRATISTELCRAIHMLRTASARRALHSTGAVMVASIHATNRLELSAQKKAESIAVERFPRVTASDKLQRADWEIVKACPSCCKTIREDSGQDNLYRARLIDRQLRWSAPPSSLRLIVWIWDCPRCSSSNPFLPHPLSSLVGETLNESVLIVVAAD